MKREEIEHPDNIILTERSSFNIFRVRGITMKSQLWFPPSLYERERLVLPARKGAIQEKRDSDGNRRDTRRGLKLFRASRPGFMPDDEDDRHVNDAFPVYPLTDADRCRTGRSHEGRTR